MLSASLNKIFSSFLPEIVDDRTIADGVHVIRKTTKVTNFKHSRLDYIRIIYILYYKFTGFLGCFFIYFMDK